jgi:uncharacterized LabA/DUF88 family protein
MHDNYFFVDGSALLADVRRVRRELVSDLPSTAKFRLTTFAGLFAGPAFRQFHDSHYRRFVFYFVQDDERLRSIVELPEFTVPGSVRDLRIEYCGKRITQFKQAKNWLDDHEAPEYGQERVYRSEKAVDTQICCDALQLAATGKLDRLFLYTNDYDFVPLCRTLRQLGVNITLFHLHEGNVNKELVTECDAFLVMERGHIHACFS